MSHIKAVQDMLRQEGISLTIDKEPMSHLFCFGYGYCARALRQRLQADQWQVSASYRNDKDKEALEKDGVSPYLFLDQEGLGKGVQVLSEITHVLVSIPPGQGGDVVLNHHAEDLARLGGGIEWIGYLSTTGVYGDAGGEWVDESRPANPRPGRGQRRWQAEQAWQSLGDHLNLAVMRFRLAGIYGPGRNQLIGVRDGTAKRIDKEGQVFCRIHVSDIVDVLLASMAKPMAGGCYNVADDLPAPPGDVVAFAAQLLGKEPPALIPFEQAELSPMGKSFYKENKRVSNQRIKSELGVELKYPSYREGLKALFEAGD
jgi:nucleoside-diphosphate-sugar epimerase